MQPKTSQASKYQNCSVETSVLVKQICWLSESFPRSVSESGQVKEFATDAAENEL